MYESGSVAIVGIADLVPGRHESLDSYWGLTTGVAADAMRDAGVGTRDIDGVVYSKSGYPLAGGDFPSSFAQRMGLGPVWLETAPHGGAQTGSPIWRAAVGIATGLASTVLVVSGDNRKSRLSRDGVVGRIAGQNLDDEFENHTGMIFPSLFALLAHRHMFEYGTTPEQLASVAVAHRGWAAIHPDATMRDRITETDVLTSRMISSPLHLLDLCLVTDGGAALVMVAAERAHEFTDHPVYVRGFGDCGESQAISYLDGFLDSPILRRAGQTALRMADLDIDDIDVLYPYDPSTFHVLWALECLGVCAAGESGPFVAEGHLGPKGSRPANTHGGLLSYCHPGMPGALLSVIEAVRQLRGEAGDRQVAGARTALTQGMGGFMTMGVNILSSERSS